MSTPASSLPRPVRRPIAWPEWLREPLLHFVLLGAVLFGIDHMLVSRADDPRVIVMGADVDKEAVTLFKAARGHDPDAKELESLRRAWLDNEVLYREGLALGVDKGDSAIRERVIFKALSVVDANVKPPPMDETLLREWFEKNRARYDEPQRCDFQEAVLAGEATESAVRAFVDTLNKGTPGETDAGLRVFKGRPHANLVEGYGDEFARSFEQSPVGEWRAFRTRQGWRAMRLDAVTAAKPASFDALRGVLLHDWIDAAMSEQRSAAVRALAKKYTIRLEGAAR